MPAPPSRALRVSIRKACGALARSAAIRAPHAGKPLAVCPATREKKVGIHTHRSIV